MTRAPFALVSRLLALLALLALAWPGAMPVSATNTSAGPAPLAVMGEICGHAPDTPEAPGDCPHCLSCVHAGRAAWLRRAGHADCGYQAARGALCRQATPYDNHGKVMTEGIRRITGTGELPDAWYDEFAFRAAVGPELVPGTELVVPVTQTCANGQVASTEVAVPG